MSAASTIKIRKYSWFKSSNGKRLFVIVGIWYGADQVPLEVEILEVYQNIPIIHPYKEIERLISSGDIIPL